MYVLMYRLYFALCRIKKKYSEHPDKQKERWNNVTKFVLGYIEAYYNLFVVRRWSNCPSTRMGVSSKVHNQKIIVSLTSFPGRIDTVWISIESLLRQTVKPDQIILWLASTQFDGLDCLPQRLLDLQKRGLTIRFCDDLRSHKKYFYVMQEYPEDLVILADDDIIYPSDMVEKLMRMHQKYPNDICVITGQKMEKGKLPSQWRNPLLKERLEHSEEVQIFTGSGSLFPPHSLSECAFDAEGIRANCPYADDLWLTFMAHKKGTRITALYPWRAFPVMIYGTGDNSLWKINAAQGQNDQQWINVKNNMDMTQNS